MSGPTLDAVLDALVEFSPAYVVRDRADLVEVIDLLATATHNGAVPEGLRELANTARYRITHG